MYTFPSVNETAHAGYNVGQVRATDTDTGQNAEIRYRITQVTDNRNGM